MQGIPGEMQQRVERLVAVVRQGKCLAGVEQALEIASSRQFVGVKPGFAQRDADQVGDSAQQLQLERLPLPRRFDVGAREHRVHLVAYEDRRDEHRSRRLAHFVRAGFDDYDAVPPRLLEPVDDRQRTDVHVDTHAFRSLLDDETVAGGTKNGGEIRRA